MQTEQSYTVKGCWPFPLDMLRHDGSRAATGEDQEIINRLTSDFAPDRLVFKEVEINLVGPRKPNTARWESFSWAVPSDTDHIFFKEAAKRDREEKALFEVALSKLSDEERAVVMARVNRAGTC